MGRRYFGTDGVRGVAGEFLTADLVERLGRAAVLWGGAERIFVGRDTRGSGAELEAALAEGAASAGADVVLGGVLPSGAVGLRAVDFDLGAVITASHNPPEYNGVKFFRRAGKLSDADEEAIEALLDAAPTGERGSIDRDDTVAAAYVEFATTTFGADLSGVDVVLDCANGACSGIAVEAFERLGAKVHAIGNAPDGTNINLGCGATDTALLQRMVVERGAALGLAFDGDGDRLIAVDENGDVVDGDGILTILALAQRPEVVAVTLMTNLGFHALMADNGIRVVTTDVGDRYVLEALEREGGVLGGEQSGHIIHLADHVTGDGLPAALMLCAALDGRSLAEAAGVLQRYTQCKENVRVASKDLTRPVQEAVEQVNAELGDDGRVLVRPSGTEPIIRVLVEARDGEKAREACATIASLVESELG
jgi:phosphoglucosamine mutase